MTTVNGSRVPDFAGQGEEARHALAVTLSVDDENSVSQLMVLLGDPSWRVRKAALNSFEGFRRRPELVQPLVDSLADPDNAGLRSAAAEALARMGELAVPNLAAALSSRDHDQRKFLVEVLGSIGSGAAREALMAVLDDPDDNVRASVADALGRSGGDDVAALLLRRMNEHSNDLQLVASSMAALARMDARLSVRQLEPYLSRAGLERLLLPLLGLSGDPAAILLLLDALTNGSRGTRALAIRALRRLHGRFDEANAAVLRQAMRDSPTVASRLQDALGSTDDEVGEDAAFLLGEIADPPRAPSILIAACARSFVQIAAEAVGKCGADAVPFLLHSIDDADVEARVLFLEVIETLADERAVPKLLEISGGADSRAAEAAIRALGRLGGQESVNLLTTTVNTGTPELARQAVLTLCAIGRRHPDAVAAGVRAALFDGEMSPDWIIVISSLGRLEDVDLLVSASHHGDPEVRRAAVEAFRSLRGDVDEDAVVLALADENAGVRAAAARALGGYRSARALEALLIAAHDHDAWVVAEAVKSLGSVGGPQAESTLRAAVASNSSLIVIAALDGLSRLAPRNLAAPLRRALNHADPEVVCEVVRVATLVLEKSDSEQILSECLGHRSWHVRLAAANAAVQRQTTIPENVLHARLDEETEPLVRLALERLLRQER